MKLYTDILLKWAKKVTGQSKFMNGLWEKSCFSFDEMSNISKELRKKLDENFIINNVKINNSQFSADKTIKNSFILHDNHLIEGVLIPTPERMTACVSSQVGCSLTCKFCATGYMERKRNLNPDEIYDQVVLIDAAGKRELWPASNQYCLHGYGRTAAQL